MYQPLASAAHVFTRKKSLLQGRFENTPDFTKYLNSVGTGFSHPDKALTLRDLFVYPELKLANIAAKNVTSIHGEQVLRFVSTSEYLQIAGAPTSGKSTLARALYLDLKHEFAFVPLLVQASLIKGTSTEDLHKTVMQSFSQQYRDASSERFMQLARERKVLLIDDWHKLRIAGKARKKMLDGLRNLFGKVIVFSDDITLLQLLADASEDGSASYGEYCEIKQFGYRLRSELIRKWHNLGTDLGIDDMELTSKISASENLLDTLVKKGTVPSWPIFILSVLQASSLAVEETALYGSYGHLYEALLTRRMADASRRRQTLGQKYTYLSLVAYRLFQTGMLSLSETALREIHRKYELEYQVTENPDLLWEELQDAQVLLRSGDDFSFQYKYAYYFFVAKYFQQGMADLKGANSLKAEEEPGKSLWNRVQSILNAKNVVLQTEAAVDSAKPRFGTPQTILPRLGQGSFRILVTDAYKRTCAMSGSHVLHVLDAAHIKPYTKGGEHAVPNGLLLRQDLHTLFDRGDVTVTPDYSVEVSQRIKEEFNNGKEYYAMHGTRLAVPGAMAFRPDPELLEWHNESVFVA